MPQTVMLTLPWAVTLRPCRRPPQKLSMWVAMGGVVWKVTCSPPARCSLLERRRGSTHPPPH